MSYRVVSYFSFFYLSYLTCHVFIYLFIFIVFYCRVFFIIIILVFYLSCFILYFYLYFFTTLIRLKTLFLGLKFRLNSDPFCRTMHSPDEAQESCHSKGPPRHGPVPFPACCPRPQDCLISFPGELLARLLPARTTKPLILLFSSSRMGSKPGHLCWPLLSLRSHPRLL